MTDAAFRAALLADPADDAVRLVYADWLDDHGELGGAFLREHVRLRVLPPDHPFRPAGEVRLSELRALLEAGWLAVAEPERPVLSEEESRIRGRCTCGVIQERAGQWFPEMYRDSQDTRSAGWSKLVARVAAFTADAAEFDIWEQVDHDSHHAIVTLPASIGRLTHVRRLALYGTHLSRVPPEIGDMVALEGFSPYTSHRLHWFPYEITRCPNLRDSTVSTRALYGNRKTRPPFPLLPRGYSEAVRRQGDAERACSVCRRTFVDRGEHRVWITLRVATDDLPLLVNACSDVCVKDLPTPRAGYHPRPHRGGADGRTPER